MNDDERRGDFRHRKSISVRYKGVGGLVGYGYAETQDVSSHGLRFYSEAFLRKDLRLDLELDLESTKISIRDARVAWVVRASNTESYSIGVEFEELSPVDYRRLVEWGTEPSEEVSESTNTVEIRTDGASGNRP